MATQDITNEVWAWRTGIEKRINRQDRRIHRQDIRSDHLEREIDARHKIHFPWKLVMINMLISVAVSVVIFFAMTGLLEILDSKF